MLHINQEGGPYAGMDRFECRKKIWADMKAAGLVIKEENYTLNVPRSQRGGEIVEPMVSTQWFVRMQVLAEAALKAVQDGSIRIIPERFTKVYFNWLENIQDWCISRQLWWGHRIPVWYCDDCGEMTCTREDPTSMWFTAAAKRSTRIRMYWIPGFHRAYGRFPPWAGRKKPRIINISTQLPSWKPAMTSSSSGWRA